MTENNVDRIIGSDIGVEAENEEDENEDSEEDEEDSEFYDSSYEQSEDEQCFLENDDKAFDNNAPDVDPIADEEEKSDDMTVSDVNSLDSM
ncbi:hypothetical protein GBA52_010550 [Prunus armeniaca]|nr:hypothetical protein GBA52_010550 [Prunus armeniaca]